MSGRQRRFLHRRTRQRRHAAGPMVPSGDTAVPLLAAAVAQANDAIVITDALLDPPGPRIVFVNPAFCALTGYAPDELLGRSPRLLQGPASDRAVLDRVRRALEHGHTFQGEIVNYRKDGQAYVLRWHLAPIRAAAGAITHWVAIQRDVTADHAAAADQAQLVATAQQALRLRDELLNTVAHELRTPLTALIGYSHLLQHSVTTPPGPPAQLARYAAHMRRQAEHLNAVLTELLDLERLAAGALPLASVPIDLVALTSEVTAAFGARLSARHPLQVLVPSTALVVAGDAVRLRHVLEELLTNALTFSPAGGTITVTLAQEAAVATLTVTDQGIGIPATALARVGERYYRAPNIDTHRMPGFGIGLYTVHELVRRHGGQVGVDSVAGQGTTVRLVLPVR